MFEIIAQILIFGVLGAFFLLLILSATTPNPDGGEDDLPLL